jgi:hypothetical protein
VYIGKTLFSQIMDFLPWKTFHRIVARYRKLSRENPNRISPTN